MRICIPTGTADATGEKTCFQAKSGFFHSGVSFFCSEFCRVFPLKIRKTPARGTRQAIHAAPVRALLVATALPAGRTGCSPIARETRINTAPTHNNSPANPAGETEKPAPRARRSTQSSPSAIPENPVWPRAFPAADQHGARRREEGQSSGWNRCVVRRGARPIARPDTKVSLRNPRAPICSILRAATRGTSPPAGRSTNPRSGESPENDHCCFCHLRPVRCP